MFFNKKNTVINYDFKENLYDISFSINWINQIRKIFANVVGLIYNQENLVEITNKYIDKIIKWWWDEFYSDLKIAFKKQCNNNNDFYNFILIDEDFWMFNLITEYNHRISILNLGNEKYSELYNFLENSWHNDFLKEKWIYLDTYDIDELFFISKNNFYKNLFKYKYKEEWIKDISFIENDLLNFLIDDYKLSEKEKNKYDIYINFCNNFSKELLMDVSFNFKELDICFNKEPFYGQPYTSYFYKKEREILKIDYKKIINFYENSILDYVGENNKISKKNIEIIKTILFEDLKYIIDIEFDIEGKYIFIYSDFLNLNINFK